MTDDLRYHPQVPHDLAQAIGHYATISDDLANRFRSHAGEALGMIARFPEMYPIAFDDVRFIRIRNFPYLVQYRILKSTPFVLGVFHTSTDPKSWRQRASGLDAG